MTGSRKTDLPSDPTIRVAALFGFRKVQKEGLLVTIEIDGEALSSNGATLISNPANRKWECWWLAKLDLPNGSRIKLSTKVGVRGRGQDSERTTTQYFITDSNAPVAEIKVNKVGFRKYPLLKGAFFTVSAKSTQDETEQLVEGILASTEDIDDATKKPSNSSDKKE